jgi:hypothetical protein
VAAGRGINSQVVLSSTIWNHWLETTTDPASSLSLQIVLLTNESSFRKPAGSTWRRESVWHAVKGFHFVQIKRRCSVLYHVESCTNNESWPCLAGCFFGI